MFLTRPASCLVSSSWLPTPCSSYPTLLLANSELFLPLSPLSLHSGLGAPPLQLEIVIVSVTVTVNRKVDEYGNL